MRLDFIVPALNEEEGIGTVIEHFPVGELEEAGYEVRVLVVDGGSSDATVEVAEDHGAEVIVEERQGYGRAYKTGFEHSDADVIVTSDADTTYSLDRVPEMVEMLDEYDFITTNRLSDMADGSMPLLNRVGNEALTLTSKLLFGVPFRDSQSGMWVFRREVLDELELTSDGMPFSEEIKIEAYRNGLDVYEYDIRYFRREGEKELHPISDGVENMVFLFRKRLATLRS